MTSSSSSSSFLRPLAHRRSCKHPDQQSSLIQFSSEPVINKIIVTNRRKNAPLKTNMDISSSRQRRRASSLISSSITAFPKEQDDIVINSQQLDRWVRDSAIQIVNNLDEAPLLVHINCCNNDPNTITIKMVKEEKDNPPPPQPPDAVILVKQVVYNCSSTKLWGILIQGKGKSCTASYLLKTSRVGLCTHFCLSTRLHCFVEHAHIQLQNMWLAH